MSFANPFAPKPRGVMSEVARVKDLVRAVLDLSEDTGITVSEIVCRDPSCPGLETAILILPAGGPSLLVKIPGPVAAVDREVLAVAIGTAPGIP